MCCAIICCIVMISDDLEKEVVVQAQKEKLEKWGVYLSWVQKEKRVVFVNL